MTRGKNENWVRTQGRYSGEGCITTDPHSSPVTRPTSSSCQSMDVRHQRSRSQKKMLKELRLGLVLDRITWCPAASGWKQPEDSATLTCHLQRGISTSRCPQVVACHTSVDTLVGARAAPVHDAREEEGAAGQQQAVRARILARGGHSRPILVPLDVGPGPSLRAAGQRGRLASGDQQIWWLLHDARHRVLRLDP